MTAAAGPGPPVHPIEVESYRILDRRVDLSGLDPLVRAVVARLVHATADLSFVTSARLTVAAVEAGIDALGRGAPIVVDAAMVAAGAPSLATQCLLGEVPVAPPGDTRAAAAVRLAAARHPVGTVFAIGNAPTALAALVELAAAGEVEPALVIGLPVGFVGAAEAKAALWASPLRDRAITNVGERGGSPCAAAALNALARLARADRADKANGAGSGDGGER